MLNMCTSSCANTVLTVLFTKNLADDHESNKLLKNHGNDKETASAWLPQLVKT